MGLKGNRPNQGGVGAVEGLRASSSAWGSGLFGLQAALPAAVADGLEEV